MLGALIGAGATIASSLFSRNAAEKQAARQEKLQREFAQKGIQWKAADAEAAGISKLYALGANTTAYSPVSVGGGNGIAEAGQSIGRAIDATASPAGRAGHLATTIAETQLEGLKIDNDIKRQNLLSTMAQRNQPGNPPAYMNTNDTTHLIPGQGNAEAWANIPPLPNGPALANDMKLKRDINPANRDYPQVLAGVNPEAELYRTGGGGFAPMIPQTLGEATESQPLGAFQWMMRNQLMPTLNDAYRHKPFTDENGTHWTFNPFLGNYVPTSRPMSWRHLMEGLRSRR